MITYHDLHGDYQIEFVLHLFQIGNSEQRLPTKRKMKTVKCSNHAHLLIILFMADYVNSKWQTRSL